MPLQFDRAWRFKPPADGHFVNASIPDGAVSDFMELVDKVRTDNSGWAVAEHFKGSFGSRSQSSSESWAHSDLRSAMDDAAENAPLFIESFFEGCQSLQRQSEDWFVPDEAFINAVLAKHNVGYEVRPPKLVAREIGGAPITVEKPPASFAEQAREKFEKSLERSNELLLQGHAREAVQEVLWLLETVTTAFRGLETQAGKIEGNYFNKIVGDLRSKNAGTTLNRVLEWITTMHGYLSSPTGGGVRHGIDLNSGVSLDLNQAQLFCNLTRSYIQYLLVEHSALFNPSK